MAYKGTKRFYYVDSDKNEHGYLYAVDQAEADRLGNKEKLKFCKLITREPKSKAEIMRARRKRLRDNNMVPIDRHVDKRDQKDVNTYIDNVNIARGVK